MIWDGDCRFCELWIERWRSLAAGRVDDATSQAVAGRFPEIPQEMFECSVVYIDSDGRVFAGAHAIFRSLRFRAWQRSLFWSYNNFGSFAVVSEFFYRFVARHRRISSRITRALWGKNVCLPVYFRTRNWFLRGLGIVYLTAFASFWVQIDGLIGSNGILPVNEFLGAVRQDLGSHAISVLPTLCWLNSSDAFLHALCATGVVVSILLIAGLVPIVCLIVLFVCYLSLTIAGQTFFYFQWYILLLETGFLALFFASPCLWLNSTKQSPVPKLGLFLLKLLLFKLMFMSGVVKLTAGDRSWWDLTALDYHYWSQPLPTVFAWFADKQPEWFKKFSVAACLIIEIIVPFFIWAPRRLRLIAATLLIGLQIAIAITGNYCFFNLLTIVLCLLVLDDSVWSGRMALREGRAPSNPASAGMASREVRSPLQRVFGMSQMIAAITVLVFTLPLNAWHIYSAFFERPPEMPPLVNAIEEKVEPFRIVSGYGLFRVMTKDRREIVIEGSHDGIEFVPYEFKWKPGDINRVPGWCAPHQPRLDWQMWFAALGSARQNQWFVRLVGCLLENKPDVTKLFAVNPFPKDPPIYIRARFYRYRFASRDEHNRTGAWWTREELGEYLPTVSLK